MVPAASITVKETNEFLDGVEALGVVLKKVVKDGKINAADIPYAFELINAQPKILAMIDGISEIPNEMRDLSLDEAQAVLGKLVSVIKKVKAA